MNKFNKLKELLQGSDQFPIQFIKKNGEIRKMSVLPYSMIATLVQDAGKADNAEELSMEEDDWQSWVGGCDDTPIVNEDPESKKKSNFVVYEDGVGWRSFVLDNLMTVGE